ncbi:hypothetical protein ACFLW2_04085 [Chloroflexota bacterium]
MGTRRYYTSTKIGLGGCVIGILLSFLLAPVRLIILLLAVVFMPILRLIRRRPSSYHTEDDKT